MFGNFPHMLDLNDYKKEIWLELLNLAHSIKSERQRYANAFAGKIMTTLFYEDSTRTRHSFQSAILRLGGDFLDFDYKRSSNNKGESLKDTAIMFSGYTDIISIRHSLAGAAKAVAQYVNIPVINAGDGQHLHPTQTLTDLFTLFEELGTLEGLKIGICGDLKLGRTSHSLCKAMSCFMGNNFVFIPCEGFGMPEEVTDFAAKNGCKIEIANSLEDVIGDLNVLYMTRIQKERFENPVNVKNFVVDRKMLELAPKNLKLLHPLPRNEEISTEVDGDSRSLYFKQAEYGVYIRIALIMALFENKNHNPTIFKGKILDKTCKNYNCVTQFEKYLPHYFTEENGICKCEYCEKNLD